MDAELNKSVADQSSISQTGFNVLIENFDNTSKPISIQIKKNDNSRQVLSHFSKKLVELLSIDVNEFTELLQTEATAYTLCRIEQNGKTVILDETKPVLRQLSDGMCKLGFRLKEYPRDITALRSFISRFLYYCQIRRDLRDKKVTLPSDNNVTTTKLASYVNQIEGHNDIESKIQVTQTNFNDVSKANALAEFVKVAIKLPVKEPDTAYDKINCFPVVIGHLNEDISPVRVYLNKKETARDLFDKYCDDLAVIYGIASPNTKEDEAKTMKDIMKSERNWFGLRYSDHSGRLHWLENDKPVYKQFTEARVNRHTQDENPNTYRITFRMKHFPAELKDLKCNITKFLFYLQIRRDLIQGRTICPSSDCVRLGALIYQAEEGDAPFEKIDDIEELVKTHSKKLFLADNTELSEKILRTWYEMKNKMMKSEAVTALLELVTTFITYGIDPFEVKPRFTVNHDPDMPVMGDTSSLVGDASNDGSRSLTLKKTFSLPSPKSKLENGATLTVPYAKAKDQDKPKYYLGISHDGMQFFVGTKPAVCWLWKDIISMRYSKDIFKIVVVSATEAESKPREVKYAFRMRCPSSALAIWRWANDRKCFFTLPSSNSARKIKSSNSILRRPTSWRFSGSSQSEINAAVNDKVSKPQTDSSIMYSSMRIVGANAIKLNDELNGISKTARVSTSSRPALNMDEIEPKTLNGNGEINVRIERDFTDSIDAKANNCSSVDRTDALKLSDNIEEESIEAKNVKQTEKAPRNLSNGNIRTTKNALKNESAIIPNRNFALLAFGVLGILLAISIFVLEMGSQPGKPSGAFHSMAQNLYQTPFVRSFATNFYQPAREAFVSSLSGSSNARSNPHSAKPKNN